METKKVASTSSVPETSTPSVLETSIPVASTAASDLGFLKREILRSGGGNGDSLMAAFKTRLRQVLNEAASESKGEEVALPMGAICRFFLKHTTLFSKLGQEERYNRAYRYLSQSSKDIARIGWSITRRGEKKFLVYSGKTSTE